MDNSQTFTPSQLSPAAPAAARAVFRALKNLKHGCLTLQLPDGQTLRFGQPDSQPGGLSGQIRLQNWKLFAATLKSGDIGVAESFINGDWNTPNLTSLLHLLIANRDHFEALIYGSWWGSLLHRARHWLNRNSRRGSQKNIHAHYDLGNEFYRLWLDPTMNYSSAWFEGHRDGSLVQAQHAKVHRALTECAVQPGQRVLEIGCGWGALAEAAAREFKADVTGVTLSNEQLAWGQARLKAAGLSGELRYQDYRDITDAPFDAIVSIEMFEAVGRAYWPSYFSAVKRLLKPGGAACVQSITIRDDLFAAYVKSSDFIQQYIFPGGLLPSVSAFKAAAAQAGLQVVNTLEFGLDYAETLKRWHAKFVSAEGPVRKLGFDTRFMRIWEFYLSYCEAAFTTGNTSVMQFTLRHAP
jgi:cyclopropane-fatty-acyl-phospholipid synthase